MANCYPDVPEREAVVIGCQNIFHLVGWLLLCNGWKGN